MTIFADHTAQPPCGRGAEPTTRRTAEFNDDPPAEFLDSRDYLLPSRHQSSSSPPTAPWTRHTEQGKEPGHEYSLPRDGSTA